MNRKMILTLFILSLFVGASVFAQHGAVGGGEMTESDLQTYVDRLAEYIASPYGRAVFPEVSIHDQLSPETFAQIAKNTRSTTQLGRPVDQFGNPRTCVSYHENSDRWFKCNQMELEKTLVNQTQIYKLVLHELFVQAGIEAPHGRDIPSDYQISSRIMKHLFRDDVWGWMPGDLPKNPLLSNGLWCTDQPMITADDLQTLLKVQVLFWDKQGSVKLYEFQNRIAKLLFEGESLKPNSVELPLGQISPQRQTYRFYPLHARDPSREQQLWLGTNEDFRLRSSYTREPTGEEWTQTMGSLFISKNSRLRQFLFACQALESWPESNLFPIVESLTNRSEIKR